MESRKITWDIGMAIMRPEAIASIQNLEQAALRLGLESDSFIRAISQAKSSLTSAILKETLTDALKGSKMKETDTVDFYPITTETVSFGHKSGTKEYHIKLVKSVTGKSLVILRFGKKSTFGQLKIEQYNTHAEADKFFEKKIEERLKKGYSVSPGKDPKEQSCDTMEEFSKDMGRGLMAKVGASNLKHLFPDMDVSSIPEATPSHLTEDGRIDTEAAAKKAKEEADRARKVRENLEREQREAAAKEYQANPNYGAF